MISTTFFLDKVVEFLFNLSLLLTHPWEPSLACFVYLKPLGHFQKITIKKDVKIKLFVFLTGISISVMPRLLCWISITRTCTTAKWSCDSMTRIPPRRMLNLRRCVNKCTLLVCSIVHRCNNVSKRLLAVFLHKNLVHDKRKNSDWFHLWAVPILQYEAYKINCQISSSELFFSFLNIGQKNSK